MVANDKPVLIYSTFPSVADAEMVGAELVERGLAACVNILPGMTSIYIWQGQRHRDSEAVMLVKTRKELSDRVIAAVRGLHPHANPALLVIPIDGGSADFLAWIMASTQPAS